MQQVKDSHIKSICGVPLKGNKLVRVAFIDESGVSPNDPVVAVSAVIIKGDKQLSDVEDKLLSLIDTFIPASARNGFFFHASDIFSGNGFFADRNLWPAERRFEILDSLADVIVSHELPVSHSSKNKAELNKKLAEQDIHIDKSIDVGHGFCFAICCGGIEIFMRGVGDGQENTMLIAEHRHETNALLKYIHEIYRSPKLIAENEINSSIFPYQRIRNGLAIQKKEEAPGLQLADFCAFIFRSIEIENKWRFDKIAEWHEKIMALSILQDKELQATILPFLRSA